MGKNNQLVISVKKIENMYERDLFDISNRIYIVEEMDIDKQIGVLVGFSSTLKGVNGIARKYMKNHNIEYGIDVRVNE